MTTDVAEFLAAASDSLRCDRARNTVLLTVAEQVRLNPNRFARRGGEARYGWRDGQPGAAFLVTPPFPLVLTAMTAGDAAELARDLYQRTGGGVAGVNGRPETAAAFAAAWCALARAQAEVQREERLYRLGPLTGPDPVPEGAPRVAGEADAALLVRWLGEFHDEVRSFGEEDPAVAVRDRLSHEGFTLWETGGRATAMAGMSRLVAGMTRVGPVYTPPGLRGHGYGSAVTAAVSRQALDAGADEVVLFTDLANRVSNSIYQHIGYQAVEDRVILAFTGA